MRSYTFTINPMAGKGRGRRLLRTLEGLIHEHFPDAEVIVTQRRMHAYEIAAERRDDAGRTIVAVGGDGTVNETGNGIIGGSASMSVVPIGSGNDFVKMFGISTDPQKAILQIKSGGMRTADAGFVRIESGDGSVVERYFLNGVGIGFDAAVAHQTTKFKHLKGFSLYAASVAATLFRYQTPNMTMTLNGAAMNGRHFLIAVGNGKCAGGGFYLTPEAEIDDGLLDVCLVDEVGVSEVLRIFPSVMKGKHKKHKKVHFYRTDILRVETGRTVMLHADGEVIATDARSIDIAVKPMVLSVIA
jgi:diacylglycerol kinase (ATP)